MGRITSKTNKIFRKILLVSLAWLMMASSASAFVKGTNHDWSKIETWRQFNSSESYHYKTIPFSSGQVGPLACSWFSATYALRKSGIVDETFTPLTLMDKVENAGRSFSSGNHYMAWWKLGDAKLFGDKVRYLTEEDYKGSGTGKDWVAGVNLGNMSIDNALTVLKWLVDKGYYVAPTISHPTGAHVVFLDYYDGEKNGHHDFRIGDSGGPFTYLSEYIEDVGGYSSASVLEVMVMDLSQGKTENLNTNRPSLYADGKKGRTGTTPTEDKMVAGLLQESELVGLEKVKNGLYEFQTTDLTLTPLDTLNKQQLGVLEQELNSRQSSSTNGVVSGLMISVGVLMMLGAVILLIIVVFFLKTNPEAIKKVFGKTVDEDADNSKSITPVGLYIRIGLLFGFGLLLASGALVKIVVLLFNLLGIL